MPNRGDYFIPLPHKGKVTSIGAGSLAYETVVEILQSNPTNSQRFVPAGYAHRPDLIANLFLDGPSSWWSVMAINALVDPFESLNLNDTIYLPDD
jgi:hypothetical protein|tara:strand:- start:779 stop:1063 length:285 start_codon:yes stop_codon:yes gene_type:complete